MSRKLHSFVISLQSQDCTAPGAILHGSVQALETIDLLVMSVTSALVERVA